MKIYIIYCVPCENLLFGKSFIPEIQAKIISAIEIAGYLNQAFLQSKSMKRLHFLYVDTNSQKLKVDWKVFGGAWSKMSVANLFSGLLILRKNLKKELMELIFCILVQFHTNMGVVMVKNGHGQKFA